MYFLIGKKLMQLGFKGIFTWVYNGAHKKGSKRLR